jgi:hypothetical protein
LPSADAVVRSGPVALQNLPRLLEAANIEGRKEFISAFIGGITVRPDTGALDLQLKEFPTSGAGDFTCEMVAGARYEPLQIEMKQVEKFLAGLRRVA